MRWQWVAVALLLAVGIAAFALVVVRPSFGSSDGTQYLSATVTRGNVVDDIAADGTLAATTRYGLAFGSQAALLTSDASSAASNSSAASGGGSTATWPVTAVKVAVGQAVKKGDLLAVADSTSARTAEQLAANDLAMARLQLDDANEQLDAATSDAQTRQGQIAVLNARSAVDRASQSYTTAKQAAAAATITAPADGTIEALNVTLGLAAPSGNAIVLDANGLQAQINVSETDLAAVKRGQAAEITITASGGTSTGTVDSIAPVASSGGGQGVVSYAVSVSLAAAPADVRPGMSVSVAITISEAANVLSVPSIALQGTSGAYTVRLLNADGSLTSRSVTVGLVTSTLAEIRSGLAEGDRVVTGVATNRTTTAGNGGLGGFGGLGGGGVNGGGFRQAPNNQ